VTTAMDSVHVVPPLRTPILATLLYNYSINEKEIFERKIISCIAPGMKCYKIRFLFLFNAGKILTSISAVLKSHLLSVRM